MKLPLVIKDILLDLTEYWPVVSCESIVSAAFCKYYILNAMLCTIHTHTHTRAYSVGKCTKASTTKHSKQALSPIHEIFD